ncbi:hypothetical protein VNI00_016765 [Paramarasmius palmivorus]|uniref:Uncharacterized protein n=1 Tax=Paramarasmius palmivorus TaxID=297713 RepID=A0AAW0BDY3_9AGAR
MISRISTSVVLLSTLFAILSSAVYANDIFNIARSVNELSVLEARQAGLDPSQLPSTMPSACTNTCAKVASCGTDVQCACSNSAVLGSCFSCVVSNDKSFSADDAQSVMDGFVDGCKTLGYDAKPQKISASSSGSGSSSGSSSGSGTSNAPGGNGSDNDAISVGVAITGIVASVASVLLLV